jgi:hypothetical protein
VEYYGYYKKGHYKNKYRIKYQKLKKQSIIIVFTDPLAIKTTTEPIKIEKKTQNII